MLVHILQLPDNDCIYVTDYSEETGLEFKRRSKIKEVHRFKVVENEESASAGHLTIPIKLFNQIKESYAIKS
jgi:hypothetical protein